MGELFYTKPDCPGSKNHICFGVKKQNGDLVR